ncbi:hypothetical protein Lsan_3507 [Legionella santicrucis]|uniref:Uncharacterized protein n=1 Tax=Legionella santicrucis TaxID=45074 RepID=A0A0W0YBA1_9GAMM|nr:hypothetical protein [Legionella santicrucis]KTD53843.1 hypothetical protein Lsan_3507 [Legionella santicrucis]
MILSHQAALPNESSLPKFVPKVNVGEKFNYSGVAYQFLGEVVQNITTDKNKIEYPVIVLT